MPREVILTCSFCGNKIEKVAAKIYLVPTVPDKPITSFQSAYSHHGDACVECMKDIEGKMKRRSPRNGNGANSKPKSRRRAKP
jgi:hypothetical protein